MSGDVDLLATEVEDDLRASVRALLTDRCPPTAVAGLYDDPSAKWPGELWHALGVELGLAGLLVPEEHGGAGASAREVAVVLEEIGRAVAPVPYLTSAVLATTVLREAGSADLLPSLAAGDRVAALAVPFSAGPGASLPAVDVDADGRLTGSVTSVAGASEADTLLVPAGSALYAVATADAVVTPVVSLDMSRQLADVALDATPGRLLAADAGPALRQALTTTAGLLASEQVGVAQWCLDTTLAYLKERRQFGRVVGGFQALKHRLADLWTDVESGGAAAAYAAATQAAGDPDAATAATLAQAYCADLAVRVAEEAIQLHGGIGMTWEHPLHLYLKRAKADQIALGTPGAHRARLASLVDLPPA